MHVARRRPKPALPFAPPVVGRTVCVVARKIRAYDVDTGKVLWTAPIPAGAEGSPAIYELDGHEYVANGMRGEYMAFALPKTGSKR